MTKPLSLWRWLRPSGMTSFNFQPPSWAYLQTCSSASVCQDQKVPLPSSLLPTNQPFHFSHHPHALHLLLYLGSCSLSHTLSWKTLSCCWFFLPASWYPSGSLFLKSLFEHLSLTYLTFSLSPLLLVFPTSSLSIHVSTTTWLLSLQTAL